MSTSPASTREIVLEAFTCTLNHRLWFSTQAMANATGMPLADAADAIYDLCREGRVEHRIDPDRPWMAEYRSVES